MTSSRVSAWLLGAVLAVQIAMLPWTAHLFDITAFLNLADRVYFAHTPLTATWSFGGVLLVVLLLSQLPVLIAPRLWSLMPMRVGLLKLPFWLAEIGSALVIRWVAAQRGYSTLWALRYLLDPMVLFVTVFHGQQDSLPSFFAVLGVASMVVGRYELAAISLGFGTGAKFFPAAYVPLLFVVALRGSGLRRAIVALVVFAASAAATLVPVMALRVHAVVLSYQANSFGVSGSHVSTASLWSLLPSGISPSAQVEQLIAVAIPLILATLELRHVPRPKSLARCAMITAMSIALLNPGAHPPFALWIVGPLVLYAAVADNGLVSFMGVILSAATTMTQFCQEGGGEYFLLNYGATPAHELLRCYDSAYTMQSVVLIMAVLIVAASYWEFPAGIGRRITIGAAQTLAVVWFAAFVFAIGYEIRLAIVGHPKRAVFDEEERWLNTIVLNPVKRDNGDSCRVTYALGDIVFFAGNAYAGQFVKAALGYTLYSPEKVAIRDRWLDTERLPGTYASDDLLAVDGQPVRVTREFDVTKLLSPFRYVESMKERPCSLIADNPLLIYRFDMDAARNAAMGQTLVERFEAMKR